MRDIVIPYIKNNSGELETCLKLIERNFPHRNVHVVERHDRSPYRFAPHIDQIMKYKWAIENLDLTDEFYMFNDDFFVMEPVEGTPYYHRGTLADHIASRPYSDWYTNSLKATRDFLGKDALSYELHVPFLVDRHLLYSLIELLQPESSKYCPLIRSAYGNLFDVGGEYLDDTKDVSNFAGKTYLSTTERSFMRRPIGEYIRSKL